MAGPTMAITGMSVSGIAVATAARTLPTAPSARLSRCPNHSIPFVKSSAPTRISPSADDQQDDIHLAQLPEPAVTMATSRPPTSSASTTPEAAA